MTFDEAKKSIAKEFISKYLEWIADYNNTELTASDYGRKYGYSRSEETKTQKDTQANLVWFQANIYSGKYIGGWERVGYEKSMIYNLHQMGFLSYQYYSNYQARQTGHSDFYYINQAKAKEIYKAYKNGFFVGIN